MSSLVCPRAAGSALRSSRVSGIVPVRRLARPMAPQQLRDQQASPVVCQGVKLDAAMQALLEDAIARSTCTVGDRVGIIGLKFAEENLKEGCPIMESAIRLALYLRDYRNKQIAGRTVLELGTGIGVAGLTMAAFGANVLLTDLPEVLPVAAKNVNKNADLVKGAGGLAQVAALDWSNPPAELVAGPWDYVIGSDLVYDESSPDALAPVLARLLGSSPHATVLLSHVHRTDAIDDHMTHVFQQHGLEIGLAPRDGQDKGEDDVSIIMVRRA